MLTKEPGWYPDPQGVPQVRFWDGDTWTEYTQPFAPLEAKGHGPATAAEDYPYLADVSLRATQGPRVVSTWTPAPTFDPSAGSGPSRRGTGLTWWLVGGGLVVLAVIAVALNAVIGGAGGGGGATPTDADPSPSSTETLPPLTVGVPALGTVPEDGELATTIEIAQDGDYFLGATSDLDVALTVTPAGSTEPLVIPDDRGVDLAAAVGGEWSDPGYYVRLTAGTYDVVVTEHDGAAVDVEVAVEAATVVVLTPGTPVEVPTDGYAGAVLAIPHEAGTLVVDARGADAADGVLTFLTGSRVTTLDDRGTAMAGTTGASEFDPYVELDVEPGTTYLVLADIVGDPATFTVTATLS